MKLSHRLSGLMTGIAAFFAPALYSANNAGSKKRMEPIVEPSASTVKVNQKAKRKVTHYIGSNATLPKEVQQAIYEKAQKRRAERGYKRRRSVFKSICMYHDGNLSYSEMARIHPSWQDA